MKLLLEATTSGLLKLSEIKEFNNLGSDEKKKFIEEQIEVNKLNPSNDPKINEIIEKSILENGFMYNDNLFLLYLTRVMSSSAKNNIEAKHLEEMVRLINNDMLSPQLIRVNNSALYNPKTYGKSLQKLRAVVFLLDSDRVKAYGNPKLNPLNQILKIDTDKEVDELLNAFQTRSGEASKPTAGRAPTSTKVSRELRKLGSKEEQLSAVLGAITIILKSRKIGFSDKLRERVAAHPTIQKSIDAKDPLAAIIDTLAVLVPKVKVLTEIPYATLEKEFLDVIRDRKSKK